MGHNNKRPFTVKEMMSIILILDFDILEEFCWKSTDLLYAGFLLYFPINHEDSGDMFLENVGWLRTCYMVLHARRYDSL
jgi:hypothetical protein